MPLDSAQLATYHSEGFVLVRSLIGPEEVAALQQQVEGLHDRLDRAVVPGVTVSWEEGVTPRRIRQLMDSDRVCEGIDALTRDARLLDILEQLLGADILLFHAKLMMKAAKDGSFTPWHQDWGYWARYSREPSHVNCMLAIDAQTEANGCIRFVPGSHHAGPITHQNLGSSSFAMGLPGDLDAYASVAVAMDPGDAVFFGPLVIHGSAPNRSGADRRANTFAFDRPGNRDPELPPERLRRGVWRGSPAADGSWSQVR